MSLPVFVDSEIQALLKVITHRPDRGIDRISPRRASELLFDDIVHLPVMQQEHDLFTLVLKKLIGQENVLETEDLLRVSLNSDAELKKELIQLIKEFEELPLKYVEALYNLDHSTLSEILISGYYEKEDFIFFDPIPNFIFTRDIAVTVNDHVIITKAAKYVRHRENLLSRFILHAHPYFKHLVQEKKLINLNLVDDFPPARNGEPMAIEGGDIMILNPDYLLIGSSERSTQHALNTLKRVLFERNVVKNIVEIEVPKERSFMHIDTLFTQINTHDFVGFKPIVKDGLGSYVTVHRQDGSEEEYPSVSEFILAEIDPDVRFIWAGNGETPYQEREQWTDGCNLLTIRPGLALTYDRNPFTEKALRNMGYQIMHATELLHMIANLDIDPSEFQNTIITLPSSELSRARGGPHCMSCPILRSSIQN